jgi:hypothetical protein
MTLAGLLAFGVLAPMRALSDPIPDEVEANRVRLLKLREDPAGYETLLRQTRDFIRLPEARREQMVLLDRELRQQEPAKRHRLMAVLKRYSEWQARLPELDRKRLDEAPDALARLQVVRELRERDWVSRLPKAQRDQVARLHGRDRSDFIRKVRQQRQHQKEEWQLAFRFWDDLMKKAPLPTKLAEMPADVQTYFNEYLKPYLTPDELAALEKAEGRWPDYPRAFVSLADNHPPALPGPVGPIRASELPEQVKAMLHKNVAKFRPKLKSSEEVEKLLAKLLRREEGRWPGFGTTVSDLAHKFGVRLPYELWPSRPFYLSPAVRQFVEDRLKPVLTAEERQHLDAAVGSWPRYPLAIRELARRHNLRVPWQTLPGSPDQWNKYRRDQPAAVSMIWLTPRLASRLLLHEP